ncbi:hypothetical protein CAPTEDRAFT_203578 [Capitella teleta]|uniref:Uncharacterized protein n=1 Tax=Capitella teleta TaxID=283909 RepID=R7URM1_CAPTE|nr:hypothetical protein CAPTEDRAFT_203578 [Capitella teleta]|eukprot:ELU09159.1 hypothetical protein CAPTEDRAFT_203578 [Capitella teleta]
MRSSTFKSTTPLEKANVSRVDLDTTEVLLTRLVNPGDDHQPITQWVGIVPAGDDGYIWTLNADYLGRKANLYVAPWDVIPDGTRRVNGDDSLFEPATLQCKRIRPAVVNNARVWLRPLLNNSTKRDRTDSWPYTIRRTKVVLHFRRIAK